MQIRDIHFVVLFVLLSAPGCVTTEPAYIPLAKEVSQQIKSSNAVIVSTQDEIKADVEKSNVATYTGGGLIPALIDVAIEGSRSKSAEQDIKPIRDALVGFDMGRELQTSLGNQGKDSKKEQVTPLYKNVVAHIAPLVTGASNRKAAAAEWSKDAGAVIKQTMKQSVDRIANKIVGSLTNPDSPAAGE
ncbi:MAG: hypothetical protein E6K61_13715 [Nitrospirae bacterium]|nr:MAG: hypothetical protein E6K61_13715 [Nitrospirota bacterium]